MAVFAYILFYFIPPFFSQRNALEVSEKDGDKGIPLRGLRSSP